MSLDAASAARSLPTVLPLRRVRGLDLVTVRAGGDSLTMLFDTGGGITMISPTVAARTGCRTFGSTVGFRMTGEKLAFPLCAGATLVAGDLPITGAFAVGDLASMLGPHAPHVDGMLSLQSFPGQVVTLDLRAGKLTIETAASAARRTRDMTALEVRLATGEGGRELGAFVAVHAADALYWFEWDSQNHGGTFVAPYVAQRLGMPDSAHVSDVRLDLSPSTTVVAPARVKELIFDGVLGAGVVNRATWTLDLANSRMWVSAVDPLITLPPTPARPPRPVTQDPTGYYDMTVVVGGHPQHAAVRIERRHGVLEGTSRGEGEDEIIRLDRVVLDGNELRWTFGDPLDVDATLRFDGLSGNGTWGDGDVKRGGPAQARKVADLDAH